MIARALGHLLGRKVGSMKLLRHGAFCQWETPPIPPFVVQRFSWLLDPNLTIVEDWEPLDAAVLRAWDLAYPYQANMVVQVVDARDSVVFSHDGRQLVVAELGPDGLWVGTQAAFDVLKPMVENQAFVEFLELRARTSTRNVCPSS